MNGPGVERQLATLILFVWLNILCYTLMTSFLHRLVRVCPAVISLIDFSHSIIKHKNCDVKYFTWKYQTILHFICSCSYLFTFLISSQFYRHIRLKSTAYFLTHPVYYQNKSVQLPTYTLQQSIDISCLTSPQQQTCSSGFATVYALAGTDRRTDTVP